MIVTEGEAKAKVCPDFCAAASEGVKVVGCLASECMAWRWADNFPGPRDIDNPRKGFCGKAGYPVEIVDEA